MSITVRAMEFDDIRGFWEIRNHDVLYGTMGIPYTSYEAMKQKASAMLTNRICPIL